MTTTFDATNMTIDPAGCEWLKLEITTDPATTPTDWHASIDGGETWVVARDVDGASAWLVAGFDYDASSGQAPEFTTTKDSESVKVKLVEDPETVIRHGIRITTMSL